MGKHDPISLEKRLTITKDQVKAWAQAAEAEISEAEKNCQFSDALMKSYKEQGFNRLLRPWRHGGPSVRPTAFMELVRTVGYHSSAAAWLFYFYPIHEAWAAYLPQNRQEEIFGSDGLVVDVFTPLGKVEKDGEGYRLSGEWKFASGVIHSEWIGLGGVVPLPDGPQPCLIAIRTDEVEIVKNWDTLGLRSTGSNGVRCENVYVAPDMILPLATTVSTGMPQTTDFDPEDPSYRTPFMPRFLMGFPAVALGGAERVVDEFEARTKNRIRIYQGGQAEAQNPSGIRALANVRLRLDTLRASFDAYAEQLEAWTDQKHHVASDAERERMFALRAHIAREAMLIGVDVQTMAGGSAIFKGDPIERFTRDLITIATHTTHLYEDALQGYGKALMGIGAHPLW